eukprot:c2494_g1_i1 orf=262-1551(+)
MTRNFHRWEVDPFFSAAEEVQDSADRLESVYRTWIHAKSVDAGADDSAAIEYYRRELSTALGTAKWQLEEFERAVSYLDTDDGQTGAADDAPTRHKQFVDALQNQINLIETSLLNSGDSRDLKVLPVVHLGQEEKDDLALFLCGSRENLHEDIVKSGFCASSTPLNGKGDEEAFCTSSGSVKSKNELSDCFSTSASNSDAALSKVDFQSFDLCCRPDELGFIDRNRKGCSHLEVCIDQNSRYLFEPGHLCTDGDEISAMSGSGHYRSISSGSGCSFRKGDSADNNRIKVLKNGLVKELNSTAKLWPPFAKKLGAFNPRMSKSGLKRWKDGDGNSKDHFLMLKLTHEAIDLEKGNESLYVGGTSECYKSCVVGGGESGNMYVLRWSEALKMLQYLKFAFSTNWSVHKACAILMVLGFAGVIFLRVTALAL